MPQFNPSPRYILFSILAATLAIGGVRAADDPLENLRREHPRLLVGPSTWNDVRARADTDPRLAGLLRVIEADARKLFDEAPVERVKTGRRLLAVSRRALQRILVLAAAHNVTGDRRFVARAEHEMLAAAAFEDWNPSHFLDVGEMTAALALGYDWLHGALPTESRAAIRRAIVEKGLRPALDAEASHNSWQRRENNWNQVCWGGLTLGALAVADDEPDLARRILSAARANIGHGLAPYAPDGVYPEGPAYWAYGTSYQVVLIAALESALGTDWGLAGSSGFLASASAQLQLTGPTGRSFNFADGSERASLDVVMLWFARRTENAGLLHFHEPAMRALANEPRPAGADRFGPLAMLWWPSRDANYASTLPLAWLGRGPNSVAVFRTSWTDPRAAWLACKGGSASLNHAHMDAGTFVFEVDGVRWALDLGAQGYESLESKGVDLWNRRQDSQRWQVFRLNNRSHNTLTIDDQLQRVDGRAEFVAFSDDAAAPFAIVDLSSVYAGQARDVKRGYQLRLDRSALIQDELTGLSPGARVRWAMVTSAEVSCDGARATLREAGREISVHLREPAAAAFAVIPADPPQDSFNAPNPGRRILIATVPAPKDGNLRLVVELAPGSSRRLMRVSPGGTPLSEWMSAASR